MSILLVEDDSSLNRGITFALGKEGLDVKSVDTLSRAREILSDEQVELIILDVNLPDGNGFDFCMEIRGKSNIPIIFLTAQSTELEITNGLDMGADDYITKPFSVRELISRVNALLRRISSKGSTGNIVSKDITLNESAMKIEKGGVELFLSKKELMLVQYFMNNPQQILSKNQILAALWDNELDFVDENVVPVNIKRLREKLEDNPKKPEYVQNIRGLGYIWAQGCVRR
ncbi:MAG: response regulator transcription factor [Clostridium sp.]